MQQHDNSLGNSIPFAELYNVNYVFDVPNLHFDRSLDEDTLMEIGHGRRLYDDHVTTTTLNIGEVAESVCQMLEIDFTTTIFTTHTRNPIVCLLNKDKISRLMNDLKTHRVYLFGKLKTIRYSSDVITCIVRIVLELDRAGWFKRPADRYTQTAIGNWFRGHKLLSVNEVKHKTSNFTKEFFACGTRSQSTPQHLRHVCVYVLRNSPLAAIARHLSTFTVHSHETFNNCPHVSMFKKVFLKSPFALHDGDTVIGPNQPVEYFTKHTEPMDTWVWPHDTFVRDSDPYREKLENSIKKMQTQGICSFSKDFFITFFKWVGVTIASGATEAAVQEANNKVNDLIARVSDMIPGFQQLVTVIKSVLEGIRGKMTNTQWLYFKKFSCILLTICIFYGAYKLATISLEVARICVVSALHIFGVFSDGVNRIFDLIFVGSPKGTFQTHAGPTVLAEVLGYLAVIVFGATYTTIPAVKALKISDLNGSFNLIRNVTTAIDFATRHGKELFNIVYCWGTGKPDFFAIDIQIESYKAAFDWYTGVKKMYPDGMYKFSDNPNLAHECGLHFSTLSDMYGKMFQSGVLTDSQKVAFRCLYLSLMSMNNEAKRYLKSQNVQQEPVWVHLMGKPGVGKSTLYRYLVSCVSEHIRGMKTTDADFYARSMNSEFWNGYHGQFAVILDDLYQTLDPAERRNQTLELISMINTSSFETNQAELNDKGQMFKSSMVISTSNVYGMPDKIGIEEPGALARRCHFPIVVNRNEGYNGKQLDVDSTPAEILKSWNFDVYESIMDLQRTHGQPHAFTELKPPVHKNINFFQLADFVAARSTALKKGSSKLQSTAFEVDWSQVRRDFRGPTVETQPLEFDLMSQSEERIEVTAEFPMDFDGPKDYRFFDRSLKTPEQSEDDFQSCESGMEVHGLFGRGGWIDRFKHAVKRSIDPPMKAQIELYSQGFADTYKDHPVFKHWANHDHVHRNNEKHTVLSMLFESFLKENGRKVEDQVGLITCSRQTNAELYEVLQEFGYTGLNEEVYRDFYIWTDEIQTGTWDSNYDCRDLSMEGFNTLHITARFTLFKTLLAHCLRIADKTPFAFQFAIVGADNNYRLSLIYNQFDELYFWNSGDLNRSFGMPSLILQLRRDLIHQREYAIYPLSKWRDLTTFSWPNMYHTYKAFTTKSKLAIAFAALVGIGAVVAGLVYAFWPQIKTAETQSADKKFGNHVNQVLRKGWQRYAKAPSNQVLRNLRNKMQAQGADAKEIYYLAHGLSSTSSQLARLAAMNTRFAEFTFSDGTSSLGYIMFIFGTTGVMCKHYLGYKKTLTKISMENRPDQPGSINFYPNQFELNPDPDMDKIIIHFKPGSTGLYPSRNLYDHLNVDGSGFHGLDQPAITSMQDGCLMIRTGQQVQRSSVIITNNPSDHSEYKNKDCFVIKGAVGQRGDCGLPYLAMKDSAPNRLLGIHIGGDSDDSLMAPVYKSDFAKYYVDPTNRVSAPTDLPAFVTHSGEPIFDESAPMLEMQGTISHENISSSARGFMPTKTKYKPSIAQLKKAFPLTQAPAKLTKFKNSSGEEVSPLLLNYEKLSASIQPAWDTKTVKLMSDPSIIHEMFRLGELGKFKVRTLKEAVLGVPGKNHFGRIDMSTAMGYPFCVMKPGWKCSDWIIITEGKDYASTTVTFHPLFMDVYNYLLDCLRKGQLPPFYIMDVLKDETRPLDRVAVGKTRLFAAGNKCMLLLCRQFFGDFMDAIESNHHKGPVAVGTNAHGLDWERLYDRISQRKSSRKFLGIDVDYSNYDMGHKPIFEHKLTDVLIDYYDDAQHIPVDLFDHKFDKTELYQWLLMLMLSNMTPIHIGPYGAFKKVQMASGSFFTSLLNSMFNHWMLAVTYEALKPFDHEGTRQTDIADYDYGDDLTLGFDSCIKDWFNRVTLAQYQKQVFGMTVTSPDKSSILKPYDDVDSLTFLQRGFGKIGDYITAPLNRDSIRNSVMWTKKQPTKQEELDSFVQACKTAQIELVYHGRDVYNEDLAVINSVLRDVSPSLVLVETWDDLFHRYVQDRQF